MKVRELMEKLRQLNPELVLVNISGEPRQVFVDSRTKPGCWNENADEVHKYPAVRIA